jgi:hypothetical protein
VTHITAGRRSFRVSLSLRAREWIDRGAKYEENDVTDCNNDNRELNIDQLNEISGGMLAWVKIEGYPIASMAISARGIGAQWASAQAPAGGWGD